MLTSVLPWIAAHFIMSLCAAPLMFRVCTRLYDRGYGLAKVMGLLLVTFGAWWLANLPLGYSWNTFSFAGISASLIFVLAMSAISVWSEHREMAAFIRLRWRVLLTYEVVGIIAFALMLAFRAAVPHISYHNASAGFIDHAAEKFTDFAILNSLLTSGTFPPHDAWVSGATLNYYYFGHLLWATMIKYASVRPEIGFNLALASLFALVCVQALSLGYNLTRRLRWGFMALFLIVLASNVDGFLQLAGIASQKVFGPSGGRLWTMQSPWYMNYNFWRSSRAIQNTINEFPAFSFVLGDLHGHVSSLAIYLAGLGLSIQMWRSARSFSSLLSYELHCLDELFFAALIAGALYASNSWDAITYSGVVLVTLWASQPGRRVGGGASLRLSAGAAAFLVASVVLLLGVLAFFRPFTLNFRAPLPMPTLENIKGAISTWPFADLKWPAKFAGPDLRSDFFEWWTHWVLHLLAPLALMIAFAARANRPVKAAAGERAGANGTSSRNSALAWLCAAAAAACVLMPLWHGWIAILAFLAAAAGLFAFAFHWQPPAIRLMLGWLILFFALCLFCELFYFDDIFSGEIERINTVFKIYYGLWPLLGLASVVALRRLIRFGRTGRGVRGGRRSPLAQPCGDGLEARAPFLDSSEESHVVAGSLTGARASSPRCTTLAVGIAWIAPIVVLGGVYMVLAPLQRISSSARLGHYRTSADAKKPDENNLPLWARPSARAQNTEESLDGLRYLQYTHLNDYQAILWVRDKLSTDVVMLEAAGSQYTYSGRFGALTGRPVYAGWLMHELGWRNKTWKDNRGNASDFGTEMQRRTDTAREIYQTTDALHAHQLLLNDRIEYVIIGDAEREQYDVAEEKFFRMGEVAFSAGTTLIFRISALPPEPTPEELPQTAPPSPTLFEYHWPPLESAPLSEQFTTSTMLTTGTPTTESLRNAETTMSVINRILEFGAGHMKKETPAETVVTPWD